MSTLYRYPVKGLKPQQLETVELAAGEAIPFDRAWAIENGRGRFNPDDPQHLPKINFLMLMRDERLAALDIAFDEADSALTLFRNGRQVVRGVLSTQIGRQLIEQFIASYMEQELRGAPHIVHAEGQQLQRCRGEMPSHRQSRQRSRAGTDAWKTGGSAALPRQHLL